MINDWIVMVVEVTYAIRLFFLTPPPYDHTKQSNRTLQVLYCLLSLQLRLLFVCTLYNFGKPIMEDV